MLELVSALCALVIYDGGKKFELERLIILMGSGSLNSAIVSVTLGTVVQFIAHEL